MRTAFLFFVLSVCSLHVQAQDPQFAQSFSNPIYLNLAYAGFDGCSRVTTSYRNQWPAISGTSQTANLSYDQYVKPLHGGIAVNYQYDSQGEGVLRSQAASFVYAPTFRLFKEKLVVSPAVELGWRANYLNWDKLTFGQMIDPRYGIVYTVEEVKTKNQVNMFDMNLGLLFSHGKLVYGAAFGHVTQPNEGFAGESRLPIKYTAHISYQWDLHPSVRVSPAFIYQSQQNFNAFLPSLSVYAYHVRAGFAVRTNVSNVDAVIFMLGYQGNWITAGYSYDLTVSTLTNNTAGSHELSVAVRFNCKNKKDLRKGERQINF